MLLLEVGPCAKRKLLLDCKRGVEFALIVINAIFVEAISMFYMLQLAPERLYHILFGLRFLQINLNSTGKL